MKHSYLTFHIITILACMCFLSCTHQEFSSQFNESGSTIDENLLSEVIFDQYTGSSLEYLLSKLGTPTMTNSLSKNDLVGDLYFNERFRFSDEDNITEMEFDLGRTLTQVLAVDGIIKFDVSFPVDTKF